MFEKSIGKINTINAGAQPKAFKQMENAHALGQKNLPA